MLTQPVLIIGGGLIGLTLAQALKLRGIPFRVFERDASPNHRGPGWAISILWGLPFLKSLVPGHTYARLGSIAVNPEAEAAGEGCDMAYFDLVNGEVLFSTPGSKKRARVKRHGLREMLLEGIDVEWGKTLSVFSRQPDGTISATFADGTQAKGSLLVGCDGNSSSVRRQLLPQTWAPSPIPCLMLGPDTTILPASLGDRMCKLDPHYLHGGDAAQNVYLFFSFMDSPSSNTRADRDTYAGQVIMVFPDRPPYSEDMPPPENMHGRVQYMKKCAAGWADPFKGVVEAIPDDAALHQVRVTDWVPEAGNQWDNHGGTVTLAGDSAHPMSMFRGEAFNHGLHDLSVLVDKLQDVQNAPEDLAAAGLKSAIEAYELELQKKANAVRLSRQACLDTSDQANLTAHSPLVSERSLANSLTQQVNA